MSLLDAIFSIHIEGQEIAAHANALAEATMPGASEAEVSGPMSAAAAAMLARMPLANTEVRLPADRPAMRELYGRGLVDLKGPPLIWRRTGK
jgi:hypothetical protein